MNEEFQPSENIEDVAAPQIEQTQETSGNPSEVADPKPVQDTETNAYYAEQRRKQELDEYRSKAETYQSSLDRVARVAGYESHDQMLAELDRIEQQQQYEQEQQLYQQAGIDPNTFDQLLSNHPAIQFANQLQQKQQEELRLASEWGELVEQFPNVTPDKIPPEAFQLQEQFSKRGQHLPLLDAYLRSNIKNLGQQAEQEAIQKLQQNQLTSPGALGAEGTEHKSSYSQLSAKEKADLRARVLRGENVQL